MSTEPTMTVPPARYDDLRALFLNCTLKPSPQRSHTAVLAERSIRIMEAQGVEVAASVPSTTCWHTASNPT